MGNDCLLAHGEGELRADDVVTSMGGASQDENVPPVGAKGGQTGQTKKGQYKVRIISFNAIYFGLSIFDFRVSRGSINSFTLKSYFYYTCGGKCLIGTISFKILEILLV